MNTAGYKLTDILDDTYSDFFEYCRIAKKENSGELTSSDYIAFRTKYAKTREYVNALKTKIESYVPAEQVNELEEETTESCVPSAQGSELEEEADDYFDIDLDYGLGDFLTYDDYVVKEKSVESENDKNKKSKQEREDDTITDYNRSDCNSSFVAWERRETMSIAQILDVDNVDEYADVLTGDMGLSVRAGNVLRYSGVDNMTQVLELSYKTIMGLKNAGRTTAKNVFETVFLLINDSSCFERIRKTTHAKESLEPRISDVQCARALQAYIKGEAYDLTDLSEAAAEEYNARLPLTEELRDISLFALENKEYTAVVINGLFDFYSVYEKIKAREKEIYECVNKRTKDMKLLPCYTVYLAREKKKVFSLCEMDLENATIKDLADLVANNVDKYSEEELLFIKNFLRWVDFDITDAADRIFGFLHDPKNQRAADVLTGRFNKRTLGDIAGDYGITRERVRQMESKGLRIIRAKRSDYYQKHKWSILDMIWVMCGGRSIIRFDDVEKLIGTQYAVWLWCDLQQGGTPEFNKEHDALIMGGAPSFELISDLFDELPKLIEKTEAAALIESFALRHGADKDVLWLELKKTYSEVGAFYSCVTVTMTRMCLYILKHRFPQGFKIGNEDERRRFDRYTIELFGEKYLYATQHALDSAVGKCGVLCDRGKYIHPDYVDIDESHFDEIMEYIEQSPNKVVPYAEIYNALKERFAGTQITNRYMLQGFIGMHGTPYTLTRDYVQKEKNANIIGELEDFIKMNAPVSRDDIIDRFPFVDELYMATLNSKCRDILYIGNGYFIHSSVIVIDDEEKESIRKYLFEKCGNDHVNARALINEFYDVYPDFMMNNEIEDHHKLFAVLRYLCDDILNFDKPYISLEQDKRITNYGVLREKIGDRTEITISEIYDLCLDMGMAEGGIILSVRKLFPEFIRVDENLIMRTELTGIDEEIIEEVVNLINSKVNVSGYCASRSFTDLIWLTEIKVPWNTFLIESVAELADDKVNIIRQKSGSIHYTQDVYVSDEYADLDYEGLVVELLSKQQAEYPFQTKTEVINWLKAVGLSSSNNLPKYLRKRVTFDANGKLVIG